MAARNGQYGEHTRGQQADGPVWGKRSDAHALWRCKIDADRGWQTAVHAAARPGQWVSASVGEVVEHHVDAEGVAVW